MERQNGDGKKEAPKVNMSDGENRERERLICALRGLVYLAIHLFIKFASYVGSFYDLLLFLGGVSGAMIQLYIYLFEQRCMILLRLLSLTNGWKEFMPPVSLSIAARGRTRRVEGNILS